MERKKEIHGYYHDGDKTWIMYIDEDGKITKEEWKDE
jgi:hypothetical protein